MTIIMMTFDVVCCVILSENSHTRAHHIIVPSCMIRPSAAPKNYIKIYIEQAQCKPMPIVGARDSYARMQLNKTNEIILDKHAEVRSSKKVIYGPKSTPNP